VLTRLTEGEPGGVGLSNSWPFMAGGSAGAQVSAPFWTMPPVRFRRLFLITIRRGPVARFPYRFPIYDPLKVVWPSNVLCCICTENHRLQKVDTCGSACLRPIQNSKKRITCSWQLCKGRVLFAYISS
jgi:hypothetical protein